MLARPEFSCRGIMRQMNVVLVCTTDDPTDTWNTMPPSPPIASFPDPRAARPSGPTEPWPSNRPAALNAWVDAAGRGGAAWRSATFRLPISMPCARGTISSTPWAAASPTTAWIRCLPRRITSGGSRRSFARSARGQRLRGEEVAEFKSAMLYELAVWTMPRAGCSSSISARMRNNNTRQFQQLGPDTGFDSIGDWSVARPLARFLDRLDREDRLAKTILYNLNPADNDVLATMIGNFQDGSTPGKMQLGSGWWFLDQKDGMERQSTRCRIMGLLSRFVGMLTDSRSFLSTRGTNISAASSGTCWGRRSSKGFCPAISTGRRYGAGHLLPQRGTLLRLLPAVEPIAHQRVPLKSVFFMTRAIQCHSHLRTAKRIRQSERITLTSCRMGFSPSPNESRRAKAHPTREL